MPVAAHHLPAHHVHVRSYSVSCSDPELPSQRCTTKKTAGQPFVHIARPYRNSGRIRAFGPAFGVPLADEPLMLRGRVARADAAIRRVTAVAAQDSALDIAPLRLPTTSGRINPICRIIVSVKSGFSDNESPPSSDPRSSTRRVYRQCAVRAPKGVIRCCPPLREKQGMERPSFSVATLRRNFKARGPAALSVTYGVEHDTNSAHSSYSNDDLESNYLQADHVDESGFSNAPLAQTSAVMSRYDLTGAQPICSSVNVDVFIDSQHQPNNTDQDRGEEEHEPAKAEDQARRQWVGAAEPAIVGHSFRPENAG
jgi:hypothetical protein